MAKEWMKNPQPGGHIMGLPSGFQVSTQFHPTRPFAESEYDVLAEPLLAQEVQGSFDYMPGAISGYCAALGVIGFVFWHHAPADLLGVWAGFFCLVIGARVFSAWKFAHRKSRSTTNWARWRRVTEIGILATGVFWGWTAWAFYPLGDNSQQTVLVLVVYSFCLASVAPLARHLVMYLVFALLCGTPLGIRIAGDGSWDSMQIAVVLIIILAACAMLGVNYRRALQRIIEMKQRADVLLAELRVEKRAADAARRQAESASRAKSQFFAAASHDLRQPLHAMGLFAEALRQKNQDREVAQLVNSINESVDALEGLFSELLDITRIDAGGVGVHHAHFAIGDLLRKLRLHFEPVAFEKGPALRLRGGHHVAFADPVLVERILRNLVSNAIRYTDDGTVLVSCRRRGDQLLLQVWDTGLGIREAEQERIFDEFYQVPFQPGMTPNQRKGLGLGLAIVQRLAMLMHAPLHLRSWPGRGSVFTLQLDAGRLEPSAPAPAPGRAMTGITLEDRHIVVVEDEPAVRAGLEALLLGWGATVRSFDSVAACEAWASRAQPAQDKPDLVIADYRLEQGRTGIDAIAALRQRFGNALPAIVVTGSTLSGHDREAQEKDFHLLVKPVVPHRLRAVIAFKLRRI